MSQNPTSMRNEIFINQKRVHDTAFESAEAKNNVKFWAAGEHWSANGNPDVYIKNVKICNLE